jgi:hypothetical protein
VFRNRAISRRRASQGTLLLLWLAAVPARGQHGQTAEDEPAPEPRERPVEAEEDAENALSGVPIVAYLPETGFLLGGYGVYHFRFAGQPASEPASTVPLLAAVTSKKELGVELSPELFLPGKAYWLIGDFTARYVPDTSYFGLGNDTRAADEETYAALAFGAETEWRAQLASGLYLGVLQTLQWRGIDEVDPDGLLAMESPPGIGGGFTSGLGPQVAYDTRDNTFAPRRGTFAVLSLPIHGPRLGSEWSFTRITLDARQFVSISGPHVLAFHVLLDAVVGTAPFDRMPELAGAYALRGHLRGRFRDKQALSFEVEYRFPIYWRFGGAVFAGVGQVAPGLTDVRFDRFHFAGGAGIRFALVPEERINLRLDVAASRDGVHPYFAPGEAY